MDLRLRKFDVRIEWRYDYKELYIDIKRLISYEIVVEIFVIEEEEEDGKRN